MRGAINPRMKRRVGVVWVLLLGMANEMFAQAPSRVHVTVGPSGLPAQIEIREAEEELPLGARGLEGDARMAELRAIGRGAQLRAPVRLEVIQKGQVILAEPVGEPTREGDAVKGSLRAGSVALNVTVRGEGGALELTVETLSGEMERLALVIEPGGAIDFALAGFPLPGMDPASFSVKGGEGEVWRVDAPVPEHLFVGNGDRGWTVIPGEGWRVGPEAPVSTLMRAPDGTMTWRLFLVHQPRAVDGRGRATLMFLTHPQRFRPTDARRQGWLTWPHPEAEAAPAPLNWKGYRSFQPASAVLRADGAGLYESQAPWAVLGVGTGGDTEAAEGAGRYPARLFRFLAGTHAGQIRRIEGVSGQTIRSGGNPFPDRALLGLALVHDIGVDVGRLAHLVEGARIVGVLQRFGYFETDELTERIPWWRSAGLLRYGEGAGEADLFSDRPGESDPAARVRATVYRRPVREGARQTHTLIVLYNENPTMVRDQLYILNPEAVFGGSNGITAGEVMGAWDFSFMPDHNDWSKAGVVLGAKPAEIVLRDEEEGGVVRRQAAKGGVETYGPNLAIRGRDFRILYGRGR